MALAHEGFSIVNVASTAGHGSPPLVSTRTYGLAAADPDRFLEKAVARCNLLPRKLRRGLAYAVSKNFVIWWSKQLATPLGEKGARVVSVSPGSFDTEMGRLEKSHGAGALAEHSALQPLREGRGDRRGARLLRQRQARLPDRDRPAGERRPGSQDDRQGVAGHAAEPLTSRRQGLPRRSSRDPKPISTSRLRLAARSTSVRYRPSGRPRGGLAMPYSAQDEQFIHQLPRPFDQVDDTDPSWSDRCYFNLHSPDDELLVVDGLRATTRTRSGPVGYGKVALADGRHWDLDVFRPCTDDRDDVSAGPARWTLHRAARAMGCSSSARTAPGIEWQLQYESVAPLWELLPITIRKSGADARRHDPHQAAGPYTGWVEASTASGSRSTASTAGATAPSASATPTTSTSGSGSRPASRTGPSRPGSGSPPTAPSTTSTAASPSTTARQSKRFVTFEHDVVFDGDQKRPTHADLMFIDEDGETFHLKADSRAPRHHRLLRRGAEAPQEQRRPVRLRLERARRRRPGRDRGHAVSLDQLMALRDRRDEGPRHLRAASPGGTATPATPTGDTSPSGTRTHRVER